MLVDYVSTNGDELKTTDLAIEQVAAEAGFGSAAAMREHFGTAVGTSPLSYRRAFSTLATIRQK